MLWWLCSIRNIFQAGTGRPQEQECIRAKYWRSIHRNNLGQRISWIFCPPIFQNAMNVDIAILGNHEFDFGGDYLGWVVQKLNCPLLCANLVVTPATPNLTALSDKVQPYAIKTLDDGSKIGFIGWITPDTKFTADVGPYIDFKPVDSSVKLIIEELVSLNITRIVGLSHTGYVEDLQFASVLNGTGIDLILGAHSHSFLANDPYPITLLPKSTDQSLVVGPYPTDLGNGIAPVAQAYYASKYVGKLQTYWDDDGKLLNATGTPVVMGGSSSGNWVKEDPDIQAIVDQYKPPVRLFQRTIIGETLTLLNADKTQIRQQETTMGDATCESMVEFAFRERLSTLTSNPNNPISIAVFNGGAIRASIPVGNITVDNVLAAFPFGNTVAVVQLNGTALLETLNWAVSAVEIAEGRFLQGCWPAIWLRRKWNRHPQASQECSGVHSPTLQFQQPGEDALSQTCADWAPTWVEPPGP
eukprot:jgi/Botrbrau1/2131/Bobra.0093s0038.1